MSEDGAMSRGIVIARKKGMLRTPRDISTYERVTMGVRDADGAEENEWRITRPSQRA
jgi:hypothetical protein